MQCEFVEQEFQIVAKRPEQRAPEWFRVSGLVCRSFGVFKFNDSTGCGWSVTHLPSGKRIFVAVSAAAARTIVERLLALDFTWDKTGFSARETIRIVRLINNTLLPEFAARQWIAPGDQLERQAENTKTLTA